MITHGEKILFFRNFLILTIVIYVQMFFKVSLFCCFCSSGGLPLATNGYIAPGGQGSVWALEDNPLGVFILSNLFSSNNFPFSLF